MLYFSPNAASFRTSGSIFDGKRIENVDAAKTPIADGDEIAVFPPVAGG